MKEHSFTPYIKDILNKVFKDKSEDIYEKSLLLQYLNLKTKIDKSAVEYYRKLSELTAQIHKIGVLYNQTVRAINSYRSIKTGTDYV